MKDSKHDMKVEEKHTDRRVGMMSVEQVIKIAGFILVLALILGVAGDAIIPALETVLGAIGFPGAGGADYIKKVNIGDFSDGEGKIKVKVVNAGDEPIKMHVVLFGREKFVPEGLLDREPSNSLYSNSISPGTTVEFTISSTDSPPTALMSDWDASKLGCNARVELNKKPSGPLKLFKKPQKLDTEKKSVPNSKTSYDCS